MCVSDGFDAAAVRVVGEGRLRNQLVTLRPDVIAEQHLLKAGFDAGNEKEFAKYHSKYVLLHVSIYEKQSVL